MLLTSLALAAQLPQPFSAACRAAPAAAVVEVTGQEGRWSDVGIETWIDVVVIDEVFGALPQDLTLVVIGGAVGHIQMHVADTPRLQTDHRYTLLLQPRSDGRWAIFGGPDGVSADLHAAEACHAAP